ncbi:MAG TPA: hypothetical protein VFO96_09440 [Gemmatimonadales bacterium]|jgi:hypothetical protein|nr:hypothetical protein [Gemmatimonadales bacterium]
MPWRVVNLGPERWLVSVAAEWRASSPLWGLAFSFRAATAGGSRSAVWVSYPFESASKAALFSRADSIPDDELSALLAEQLAAPQAQ